MIDISWVYGEWIKGDDFCKVLSAHAKHTVSPQERVSTAAAVFVLESVASIEAPWPRQPYMLFSPSS